MSTKTKAQKAKTITKKPNSQKTYQLRLTITPQIQADLALARLEYPYLNDLEIIKIWLGRGRVKALNFNKKNQTKKAPTKEEIAASLDLTEPTDEEMLKHASHIFQLGENWDEEEDIIDYSKAKPFNPDKYFVKSN